MTNIEKMRELIRGEDRKNDLLKSLMEFKNAEVISDDHPEFYFRNKNPYIKLGLINTYSESHTEKTIAEVKKLTKGLTDGIVGGYSDAWDSSDWAVITVQLSDLKKSTISKALKKIKKYSPEVTVTFKRVINEVYK